MAKQKLELTWIGKEKRPKLEPRILVEDSEKSYHAKHRVSDQDIFENRLIFGDNLLALKALEQEFTGKVKCVFIDPPYNTGSAFTHYSTDGRPLTPRSPLPGEEAAGDGGRAGQNIEGQKEHRRSGSWRPVRR